MRWALVIFLVLLLVPTWAGLSPLAPLSPQPRVLARSFAPHGGWPRGIGALEPVGAVEIVARDAAFGGFSAIAMHGKAALLVSDNGALVRLRIVGDRLLLHAGNLPAGPGSGWLREDRDAESMAIDGAGRMWIGFERHNEIWRYAANGTHPEARAAPPAMRDWHGNSGAEALARLRDGRFIVIREGDFRGGGSREALLFAGDPALRDTAATRLHYLPPPGTAPSDAAVLPGGNLLVLNRRWRFPLRFGGVLVRIQARQIRPGATLRGQVIARLDTAIGGENPEGLAVARERGRTMLWIVTDNDNSRTRRTILAKFRLVE